MLDRQPIIPITPLYKCIIINRISLVAQTVKNLVVMQETQVCSLGWDDPMEKGMATHFSILAWRITRTEKPGRPKSMGYLKNGT